MQLAVLKVLFTTTLLLTLLEVTLAQSCQQLWVERNSYYKRHGYCFKTQQAIEYFGNGGCFIQNENEMPLTAAERNRIEQIEAQERSLDCREDDNPTPSLSDMTCDQLWFERNSLYQNNGYCFKSDRAIAIFGNRGCWVQNERAVQFTPTERARIEQIMQLERAKCGR